VISQLLGIVCLVLATTALFAGASLISRTGGVAGYRDEHTGGRRSWRAVGRLFRNSMLLWLTVEMIGGAAVIMATWPHVIAMPLSLPATPWSVSAPPAPTTSGGVESTPAAGTLDGTGADANHIRGFDRNGIPIWSNDRTAGNLRGEGRPGKGARRGGS
jgi:hypothetical protein